MKVEPCDCLERANAKMPQISLCQSSMNKGVFFSLAHNHSQNCITSFVSFVLLS